MLAVLSIGRRVVPIRAMCTASEDILRLLVDGRVQGDRVQHPGEAG